MSSRTAPLASLTDTVSPGRMSGVKPDQHVPPTWLTSKIPSEPTVPVAEASWPGVGQARDERGIVVHGDRDLRHPAL